MRGELKEVGVKLEPKGSNYRVTAALYDIVEENRLEYNNGLAFPTQGGAASFKGFDIEAVGRFGSLELIAAYAYTEALNTSGDNAGARVYMVPDHLASLWATYKFSLAGINGFSIGGGVRYVGVSWNGEDAYHTEPYTMFDGMVGYEDKSWRLGLNVNNIADNIAVAGCSFPDCYYAQRRTVFGTLVRKF
jgi:iron complex outermembrane receptor protein